MRIIPIESRSVKVSRGNKRYGIKLTAKPITTIGNNCNRCVWYKRCVSGDKDEGICEEIAISLKITYPIYLEEWSGGNS